MNRTTIIFTLLFLALNLHARGPWTEYWEAVPEGGTPAEVATQHVKLANTNNFDACRKLMTPEYEAWLERLGGLESSLAVFVGADLEQRFAWRELIEGGKATVWIRVFNVDRGREVNVALNLVKTTRGWKLAI